MVQSPLNNSLTTELLLTASSNTEGLSEFYPSSPKDDNSVYCGYGNAVSSKSSAELAKQPCSGVVYEI